MKVILQQDVKGQGKKGQLIEASDGYARNFLLPRKLAVPATAENVNTMKMQEKARKAQEAAEKAEDVGENFAEESRRMKRGESKRRLVKGKCSLRQAQELIEEGIEVLPVPESSGKTLN